jgi:hypothetical protein
MYANINTNHLHNTNCIQLIQKMNFTSSSKRNADTEVTVVRHNTPLACTSKDTASGALSLTKQKQCLYFKVNSELRLLVRKYVL